MTSDPLLLAEGDRLARLLGQTLRVTASDSERLVLIGRSLAVNLVGAIVPTIEQISRRSGQPLHALVQADERERPCIVIVNADGEITQRLPADDLWQDLLFRQGRLHPTVWQHLQDAVMGDEHHATRALANCLRSRPVLDALQRLLNQLLKTA